MSVVNTTLIYWLDYKHLSTFTNQYNIQTVFRRMGINFTLVTCSREDPRSFVLGVVMSTMIEMGEGVGNLVICAEKIVPVESVCVSSLCRSWR